MKSNVRTGYRVELRTPNCIKCIAIDLLCEGHQRSLDPFVSKLMLERTSGTLVLLESATGRIVAKRKLVDPFELRTLAKWTAPNLDDDLKLQHMRSVLASKAS